jgi:hypothetical protein
MSHRHGFVEHTFLRFLRQHPFHCVDCYKRFYSRSELSDGQQRQSFVVADRLKQLLQDQPLKTKIPQDEPLKTRVPQDQPSLKTKIPVKSSQVERRNFSRLRCQIPARVVVDSGSSLTGVVTGISLNGCFIESLTTVPVGSEIELSLEVRDGTHSRALVRRSVPARGMGIEFTVMTVPNFRRLQSIARDSVRLHV